MKVLKKIFVLLLFGYSVGMLAEDKVLTGLKHLKARYIENQSYQEPQTVEELFKAWKHIRPYAYSRRGYSNDNVVPVDKTLSRCFKHIRIGFFGGSKTIIKESCWQQNKLNIAELFDQIKKLYLSDLFDANRDSNFWLYVLKESDKKAPTDSIKAIKYLQNKLDKNEEKYVVQLISVAIQLYEQFYKDKPAIRYVCNYDYYGTEAGMLMGVLNTYLSDEGKKKIPLEHLVVGESFGDEDRDRSNWTDGVYFWRKVLLAMGYTADQLEDTEVKILQSILWENKQDKVIQLLRTAIAQLAPLEGKWSDISPRIWKEYLQGGYLLPGKGILSKMNDLLKEALHGYLGSKNAPLPALSDLQLSRVHFWSSVLEEMGYKDKTPESVEKQIQNILDSNNRKRISNLFGIALDRLLSLHKRIYRYLRRNKAKK